MRHWLTAAGALAIGLVGASPAQAAYHAVKINEVMTSTGGDSGARFIELTDPDEPFPSSSGPYKIIVYNGAGTLIQQQTLSQSSLAGFSWARPYLISTTLADAALGKTGDEVLTVVLPTGEGQVCFTAGPSDDPVHCVAYGGVAVPKAGAELAPAPADGQSIHRRGGSWVAGVPTPGGERPTATTSPATDATASGATLNGSVYPTGGNTTYRFEYGPTTSYGSTTPDTSAGSGTAATAASAAVSGLTPATTYHFRLVATNADGTSNGADMVFSTTAAGTAGTGGTGGTGGTVGTGNTSPAGDATAPSVTLNLPAKRVIKNLLAVKFNTSEPGTAQGSVKLAGKKIGSGKVSFATAGTKTLKLELTKVALEKLKKRKGFTRVNVTLVVKDAAGNVRTLTRSLRIRVSA